VLTLDEVCNGLRAEDGWYTVFRRNPATGLERWCWERTGTPDVREVDNPPHPPTRDGAAAALPVGWVWERRNGNWFAGVGRADPYNYTTLLHVPDTGDETLDRYMLARACRHSAQQMTDVPKYGYCPKCSGEGTHRSRLFGRDHTDTCVNGHAYPSSEAVGKHPDRGGAPPANVAPALDNLKQLFKPYQNQTCLNIERAEANPKIVNRPT